MSPLRCLLPVVWALCLNEINGYFQEESCHSFAGGSVYPQGSPKFIDHKLTWTKAVISKPAPDWEGSAVIHGEFKQLKLSDYRGKYLVLLFYPLDFTFVCPTEILAFNDRIEEFRKINTEVVACSVDSHFTHHAWTNTPRKDGGLGKLTVPLLSDLTRKISQDYGVFLEDLGHALRGLFIIDGRGILRQITMNDLPVGRSVDETLRLVQAFQYTDEHGEVCPAGWKPGQETLYMFHTFTCPSSGARRCIAAYGVRGVAVVIRWSLRVAFCAVCGWKSDSDFHPHAAQKATRRLHRITTATPRTPYAAIHLRAPEDGHIIPDPVGKKKFFEKQKN